MENIKKALNATTAIVFVVAFLLGYGVSSQIMNRNTKDALKEKETAQNTNGQFPMELANLSGAVTTETTDVPKGTTDSNAHLGSAQFGSARFGEEKGGIETTTAAVSADDQPAGITATVTVTFDKSMWIAIHEDANGMPGKILGAQMFAKGTHTGAVDLLRPTEGERKYYAMVHTDDGDRKFDQKKDMPAKNADGAAIMHAFMTIAAAGAVQEN